MHYNWKHTHTHTVRSDILKRSDTITFKEPPRSSRFGVSILTSVFQLRKIGKDATSRYSDVCVKRRNRRLIFTVRSRSRIRCNFSTCSSDLRYYYVLYSRCPETVRDVPTDRPVFRYEIVFRSKPSRFDTFDGREPAAHTLKWGNRVAAPEE